MKVGVLASGEGSNLQAILDRVHGTRGIEVVRVGSDKPDAMALDRARAAEVRCASFPSTEYADRDARDAAMSDWLAEGGVELVVLAGYMQLVTSGFLGRFPGRVVNVHPALLPAFPGLRAVRQAIEYGVKVFGVTVHFVDEGVDTGPVIFQRAVEMPDTDDPAEIREVLRPIEHDLLCEAVVAIAEDRVTRDAENPRRIRVAAPPPASGPR